jgi:hypothetical protein
VTPHYTFGHAMQPAEQFSGPSDVRGYVWWGQSSS